MGNCINTREIEKSDDKLESHWQTIKQNEQLYFLLKKDKHTCYYEGETEPPRLVWCERQVCPGYIPAKSCLTAIKIDDFQN